jgi:hypothetical protein
VTGYRMTGPGQAVLHVVFNPIPPTGGPPDKASKTWNIKIDINKSQITWTDFADRPVACGQEKQVQMSANVTFNGQVIATAPAATVDCFPPG